jgi:hypothetical protein
MFRRRVLRQVLRSAHGVGQSRPQALLTLGLGPFYLLGQLPREASKLMHVAAPRAFWHQADQSPPLYGQSIEDGFGAKLPAPDEQRERRRPWVPLCPRATW